MEQTDELREKLEVSEQPVIVVNEVAVYWLRPGDSTAEMDARAAAIRNQSEVAA